MEKDFLLFSEAVDELGLIDIMKHIKSNVLLFERAQLAYKKRHSNIELALMLNNPILLDSGLWRNEVQLCLLQEKAEEGIQVANRLDGDNICITGDVLDIFKQEGIVANLAVADSLDDAELNIYNNVKKNIKIKCLKYMPHIISHQIILALEIKIKKRFNSLLRLDYFLENLIDVEDFYALRFEKQRVNDMLVRGKESIKRNIVDVLVNVVNEEELFFVFFFFFFVFFAIKFFF